MTAEADDDLFKSVSIKELAAQWHNLPAALNHARTRTRTAYQMWSDGHLHGAELAHVLRTVWFESPFPTSAMRPSLWREMFRAVGYTKSGRITNPPDRPITLYRGASFGRQARMLAFRHSAGEIPSPEYGWSWTSDLREARSFAYRRVHGTKLAGPMRVFRIEASPESILAHIGGFESEYVIDTGTPGLSIEQVRETS